MVFEPFDTIVSKVASSLGKPDDQIRLLLILFMAYPIALGYRVLHGKWTRHAYSILLGTFLQVFMFRWDTFHFWALDLVVYFILLFVDRRRVAWVVFIVCMVHLSLMHIKRVIFDYGGWSMDATTFLMPLVSRLSSLGFVYYDGWKHEELQKVKEGKETKHGHKIKELSGEQMERMMKDRPTLLEILSYTSYPAANVAGPFFEYRDYIDFIEENGRYKSIPSSYTWAFRKLFLGISSLFFCVVIPMYCDLFDAFKDDYEKLPLYIQYIKFSIAFIGYRTSYYVVWFISDGSISLSGLSYKGCDEKGQPQFNRISCVDAIALETCTNPREGLLYWNSQTAEWLRHYVYNRLMNRKVSQTLSTMITNLTSAFWHGFYPTYYLSFFFLSIFVEISKDIYRLRNYFAFIPDLASKIIRNILVIFSLNYCAAGMVILDMDKGWAFYKRYYFFHHLGMLGLFFFLRFAATPLLLKKNKTEKMEKKIE
jgi:hypothetical protein